MTLSRPNKVLDFWSWGERPCKGRHTSLYIGSKLDAKNKVAIDRCSIKYILNCTPTRNMDPEAGCPNFFEGKDPTLTYKRIPIFDNRGEEILQHMGIARAFIEQGKHYGSVLVHCNKGISRSASFVLGYLMSTGFLRLSEALDMLKSKGITVQPNDSFYRQLQIYERQIEATRKPKGVGIEEKVGRPHARVSKDAAAPSSIVGPALPPQACCEAVSGDGSSSGINPAPHVAVRAETAEVISSARNEVVASKSLSEPGEVRKVISDNAPNFSNCQMANLQVDGQKRPAESDLLPGGDRKKRLM